MEAAAKPVVKEDPYNLAWILSATLGIGVLYPWNAFINSFAYFSGLYPTLHYPFVISLLFNGAITLSSMFTVKLDKLPLAGRIVWSILLQVIPMGIVPFFPYMDLSMKASAFLTFGMAILTGLASGVMFGSVFGLLSKLPDRYIGAAMSGSGVAGILATGLFLITSAIIKDPLSPAGLQYGAEIYFLSGAFIMFINLVAYMWLARLPITRKYVVESGGKKKLATEESALLHGADSASTNAPATPAVNWWHVLKKIWVQFALVWFVFFVTLNLFPAVMLLIPSSTNNQMFGNYIILVFCIFDFVGRTLPEFTRFIPPNRLWILVLSRALFFVPYILCIKPMLIESDTIVYALTGVFAITNGYGSTLAMIYGPNDVEEHEKEMAGILMSFGLNFGIVAAGFSAFLSLYLLVGNIGF